MMGWPDRLVTLVVAVDSDVVVVDFCDGRLCLFFLRLWGRWSSSLGKERVPSLPPYLQVTNRNSPCKETFDRVQYPDPLVLFPRPSI